jgi:uncharacterized membrane protein
MSGYEFLKFLHIMAAVIWLGGAIALEFLEHRTHRHPGELITVARQSDWLGSRLLTPAALVLLLLGISMVLLEWSFGELWIILALSFYAAALVAGLGFIVPELRRIASFLHADEERGEVELRRRLRRLLLVARVENIFLILIVLDMVVKPR